MTEELKEFTRVLWDRLHRFTMSPWDPDEARRWFRHHWLPQVPTGGGCVCKDNFEVIMRSRPPSFDTEEAFRHWAWRAHNRVNAKLGKPAFTEEQFEQTYNKKATV